MSKNYAGVEDLLCDESFLSWYFKTDLRAIRQWDQWVAANPGHLTRIEQAVEFLQSVRLEEISFSPGQITHTESLLLEKIRLAESQSKITRMPQRRWWVAAACVLLLAGLGIGYLRLTHPSELRTAYGEIRTNQLPDGTEVIVNADSKLTYSTGWKDGKDREVWLAGEAFFHVSKTPLKSRFVVHTDHFDIIVTGTQFNVVNRRDKANIMLKEGSVILHTNEGKELKMIPGDFVEYRSAQLEKKQVKNDSVLAWKEHKLFFDNTPVRELVKIIHEHYGVTVQLADDSIGDKTISGILPNDNLEVLLQALEATSDFEVVREGNNILIKRHS
ncbi:MAG TPA: FecR domain-containing protein [Puia sp.]